jgi:crossover junction endodeoxyribonuclease RusA
MSEYVIALPFPPSVNAYYGTTCIGKNKSIAKIYIRERGRLYRQEVIKIIKDKELDLRANVPLSVSITVTPPDNRIHDIDNILKCLFDSLSHANFWEDDQWVRKLHMEYVEKDHYTKPGSVLIHVEAL